MIRADSSQEMLDLAKSFGRIPLPRGNRMGILTLGEAGVIATDAAVDAGFVLPPLDEDDRICDELLPPFWSRGNPIDLVGNLSVDIHMQILEKMAASPNFDAIVALGLPGDQRDDRHVLHGGPEGDHGLGPGFLQELPGEHR